MRTITLLALLLPTAATATPVRVPPLLGLPIVEPAEPAPRPACLPATCPETA